MIHTKWYRWIGIGLGVLLSGGVANAESKSESGPDTATSGAPAEESAAAEETAAGCRDAGVTLTFDVGSTAINGRGRSSLKAVSRWVKSGENRTVRVDGYADKSGDADRNRALSDQRADAVKGYLVSLGVEPDHVVTTGHGEEADRPDLKNTRAVAVTACEAADHSAQAEPPAPPAAAEPPAPEPAPMATQTPPEPAAPAPVAPPPPPPVVVVTTPAPPPKKDLPPSTIGLALTLGAGATGFVDDGARSFVDTGGSWEARMVVGTRLPLAFEGAYVGSAQGMQALGVSSSDAVLLGNGAEGDARLNFTRSRIQPYIFGGAGWMNYQVRNTQITTSDLQRSDNVLLIPFGVGLTARISKTFLLDIRGTGRATFDDGLFKQLAATSNAGDARLHSWNAGAHLGWEF